MQIISKNYEEIEVIFENSSSLYINATQIAKYFNKLPADWLRLKDTKSYMKAINRYGNSHNENPNDKLVVVKQGGNAQEQGTWIHKKLIIAFARWLDPHFAVWCDEVIEEILQTGSYSLQNEVLEIESFSLSEMLSETETALKIVDLVEKEKPFRLLILERILKEKSPTKLLEIDFSKSYFLPTELGILIGVSGAEMNLVLEKKGFQFRDENGIWRPTSSGKEFCLEMKNTYNQLKWKLQTIL
ncbi:KilA-N domain-containing protein [Thiovulum sp. ES]|nr:KilA-N domain-containing protein [Thiovulum sp. ES]